MGVSPAAAFNDAILGVPQRTAVLPGLRPPSWRTELGSFMRELAKMKAAGTSVVSKLEDTARVQGVDPEFLIRKFAVERLAARINASAYAVEYCFKGGMIMLRPTRLAAGCVPCVRRP